jgi:hypothetical protein
MTGTLITCGSIAAAAWLPLTGLAHRLSRRRPTWTSGLTPLLILAGAFGLRLLIALTTEPMLSDDIWRYVHDGRTTVELGANPYAAPPTDSPLPYPGNNPTLVTIYQPTSQLVFAGLATLSSSERAFRLGFIAFDLLIVALLMLMLRQAGRSAWWASLYAWHPLVIAEVAWSGHQDVIGIAALLGALLLAMRARDAASAWGWAIGAGVCFALAIGVKPLVAPLALPLAWALRERWRLILPAAGSTALMLAALYLPFALWEPGLGGMIETVRTFTGKWAFNGSAHAIAYSLLGSKPAADQLMLVLLLVTLLITTFTTDLYRAAMVYLFAGVLLSSTAHPWYLLWSLALLPLAFSWGAWVLSLTIVLAYTAWINPAGFEPLDWARWVMFVPVYGFVLVEGAVWGRGVCRRGG